MSCRALIALLMGMALPLGGCIMVPIPTNEDKVLSGKPVAEAQLAFLAPAVTTKQEVIERLGTPFLIWEDARVFAYRWEMRQGILFWMVGGASSGAMAGGMGSTDIARRYLLLIRFDEQDRVQRFERAVVPSFTTYAEFLQEWLQQPGAPSPPDRREGIKSSR